MTLTGRTSLSTDGAAQRADYWPVPVARSIPAAALACAITFSADHSARFGLIAVGCYGIVAGITLGIMAWLRLGHSGARPYFLIQAAVTLVAGIVALLVNSGHSSSGEVRLLFLVVTIFAAVTGFLELYSGVRSRRRYVASNDWMAVGVLTVVAALAFVLIPPDFRQHFTGPDHVKRVLDASVVVVGVLGAWAAISAVFLVIAGLSAKWGTTATVASPEPESELNPHQAESENRA